MDKAPAVSSREDDIIGKVAEEAGGLGIEIADVAGTVDDLTAHAEQQSESFQQLRDVSDTMAQSNERITTAAENATRSAENATGKVEASAQTSATGLEAGSGVVLLARRSPTVVTVSFFLTLRNRTPRVR